ncbi:MAG: hypothetical protein HGA67_03895 [Candidatus Yonathbacteria bacterium]|nr:hypothetical protein [Candidatus Yonathbacteria bacterium]
MSRRWRGASSGTYQNANTWSIVISNRGTIPGGWTQGWTSTASRLLGLRPAFAKASAWQVRSRNGGWTQKNTQTFGYHKLGIKQ